MKRIAFSALAAIVAFGPATAAFAASDYYLKIEGVEGEAAAPASIDSWSWGTSNAGSLSQSGGVVSPRDPATGQASGRRLRESPTRPSTGGVRVAAGDVNGDSRPDIIVASTVPEVQRFTLFLDGASPVARQYCATGQHIPKATITMNSVAVYELENVMVSSCAAAPGPGPRQTTDTATTRCVASQCPSTGNVAMTLTGQMKHTKSGHVTLLK